MDNRYAAMDRILRDERKYILNMCKKIKKCGANVVLIQERILVDAYNELSLHFLAKTGILAVMHVERTDVEFVCRTLDCTFIPHVDSLSRQRSSGPPITSATSCCPDRDTRSSSSREWPIRAGP